jgi:hypothetical protein
MGNAHLNGNATNCRPVARTLGAAALHPASRLGKTQQRPRTACMSMPRASHASVFSTDVYGHIIYGHW